ncbi:MAG: 3-phosphoglycerate dehydrogenase [Defluviitaleaceae bacterium]|nr:3-phosphoglycerate dehydrogenase [Defluviitaleaceae bacterium]
MFNIQTLNKISPIGLKELDGRFAVADDMENPVGIILRSFKMHDMELPASLACIARAGAGVNNIPIDKCTDAGVVVFNTPGANANAVKELVLASLFLSARKIYQGINWVQDLAGKDLAIQNDVAGLVEKGKANFGGTEILSKTIGIVGIGGAIGLKVANACHALGMKVIGTDPSDSAKTLAALHLDIKVFASTDIGAIAGECDYISIHAPYMPATKHMFNAETLKLCKPGAVIINAARAELVDDEAMKAALNAGHIAWYVTDFPNNELLGHDKIITIPHLGASSEEAEENCAYMASVQMREFITKGNVVNSVNFPGAELEGDFVSRRVILFRDDEAESVCKRIQEIFSKRNKGFSIAYTVKNGLGVIIFGLATTGCNGACDIIKELPEVIRTREIQ